MRSAERETRKMPVARALFIAIIAVCAGLMPSVGSAELIDRVVAAVNNDVITRSELRQAVAFNAAIGSKGKGRRVEAETLQGIINRRLLQEAYRLKVAEVTELDAAVELSRLKGRLGSDAAFGEFLVRTGLTEERLTKLLGERLLVERFVEKKIALFARVGRDEAQAYYNGHPGEFQGKRFSEVQKQITALLAEQKVDQQLDQYIEELRGRAFIRMNELKEAGE